MLSFKPVKNVDEAVDYFSESDDYYAHEGNNGTWTGKGAESLGLQGEVDQETFRKLLAGELPTGERVRKTMTHFQKDGSRSKQRHAIDFVFSAPKSVSIAALVNGERQILKAHDNAVAFAIKELESKAIARKKRKNHSYRTNTNNLVIAAFRHDLSRAQDPQLHTHAVTMNMTQRDDGRWVALTNEEMLKNVKVIGAMYKSELARQLQTMGYQLRSTRDGFELAAIPDAAIKLFSERSMEIEENLEKKGLSRETASTKTKQKVTLATRPTKTDADRNVLREEWLKTLKEAGLTLVADTNEHHQDRPRHTTASPNGSTSPDRDANPSQASATNDQPPPAVATSSREKIDLSYVAKRSAADPSDFISPADASPDSMDSLATRAVEFAIEHLTERQGIFTVSELLEIAYLRTYGGFEEVNAAIEQAKKDGRIIQELPLYQSAKSFSRDQEAAADDITYDKFKHGDEDNKLTAASWVALTMARTGMEQDKAEKVVKDSIANGRLVKSESRFTTGAMLLSERAILELERRGRGAVQPIMSSDAAKTILSKSSLNEGQQSGAELILSTGNRFVGIQGFAGVGKSAMMSYTVDAIKTTVAKQLAEQGYQPIGLAPYGSQTRALGDLGLQSQTLASFLARTKEHEKLGDKSIIFLDEASVVPVHQMLDLMEKVDARGARLVLIGDRKQTQAVEAGKPFSQLLDGGMTAAHLVEIQRQKDPTLKAAVVHAAHDRIAKAVNTLSPNTVQIIDQERRHLRIAADYAALSPDEREKTIVVAGTNEAQTSINAKIRDALNIPKGEDVKVFVNVDMTRAQKKLASSFAVGLVITPETVSAKTFGMLRGQYYEIADVNDSSNKLTLKTADGQVLTVDPSKIGNVSVFEKKEVALAPGDTIKVTRQNESFGVKNGDRLTVSAVTPDKLVLSNGSQMPRNERLHLQYAYATTVHSSQGLTKLRVLIEANTKSLTSNRSVFYVAISRMTHALKIYTDNVKDLAKAMSREPKKYAAMELRNDDLEESVRNRVLQRTALAQAIKTPAASKSNDVPGNLPQENAKKATFTRKSM